MRTRLLIDLLVHSQLFMAFSGVCFVSAVSLVLVGEVPSSALLLAAGSGILAIHLFDSVRGADREDRISQPHRARLFRGHAFLALILSGALLILTGVFLVAANTPLWVFAAFGLLGLLAASYVFPVLSFFHARKGRPDSLKDLARLKPVLISLAWLAGACLVVFARPGPLDDTPEVGDVLSLMIVALPLLLLDSIWLDRRDRRADESYDRLTFAVRLSAKSFHGVCIMLWLLSILGCLAPGPGLHGFIIGGVIGALPMIVLGPDRIGSEVMRVVVAGFWRITGLLGILLFMA